jgi:nucleoside-diphosphate-sugar epimerase
LYLGDLLRVLEGFVFSDSTGEVNVVSGSSRSYIEVVDILKKTIPFEFKVVEAARNGELFHEEYDNTKLSRMLPGFKFTRLEDGIKETCASFKII